MSRIRTIKPEFWEDEKVGRMSRDARLLFLGLISTADDQGRFRAHPSRVASAVFPYDEIPRVEVSAWLRELEALRVIAVYVVDGETYGAIRSWARHQKVDHPAQPRLPAPPDEMSRESRESLAKVSETLAPHTPTPTSTPIEERGSRARARDEQVQEDQGQAPEPTPTAEPDPHGLAEPEDIDRRHAPSGRHRLPCTPQAVLDAWERVCVPAGHPRAVATGERVSAELLRAVTAALERAPHRGAVWWEGTYLPALVADPSLGAQTRRQAGPAGIALACREQVIGEVLARREASQARGADDVDSPARIAAIERARAELRGEDPGGGAQPSPGATQEARPTPVAQPRSTAPPGPRQGARTHGERQPVRAGQVDLTRALGGGR